MLPAGVLNDLYADLPAHSPAGYPLSTASFRPAQTGTPGNAAAGLRAESIRLVAAATASQLAPAAHFHVGAGPPASPRQTVSLAVTASETHLRRETSL